MAQKVRLLGDFRPQIDYILVMRDTVYTPFIACWAPEIEGEVQPDGTIECSWGQGHYFNDILSATAYIREKLEEEVDVEDFLKMPVEDFIKWCEE